MTVVDKASAYEIAESVESVLPRYSILVVEDEFLIAMDAVSILEGLGMSVVGPFFSLEEGLEAAERETFDVAMLDINLRGQKSYPIAERLEGLAIPFFFATGYDTPRWSGDVPKVRKPYSDREILDALRKLSGTA